jgi:hypothetical protein
MGLLGSTDQYTMRNITWEWQYKGLSNEQTFEFELTLRCFSLDPLQLRARPRQGPAVWIFSQIWCRRPRPRLAPPLAESSGNPSFPRRACCDSPGPCKFYTPNAPAQSK